MGKETGAECGLRREPVSLDDRKGDRPGREETGKEVLSGSVSIGVEGGGETVSGRFRDGKHS